MTGSAPPRQALAFGVLWLLLAGAYLGWLMVFWPGVLGEDSLAVLREIESPDQAHSGKSLLWQSFVHLFYVPTRRVEWPLVAQALLAATMLAWYWAHGMCRTMAAVLATFLALVGGQCLRCG